MLWYCDLNRMYVMWCLSSSRNKLDRRRIPCGNQTDSYNTHTHTHTLFCWIEISQCKIYRKTSNMRRTLGGNKIVDHSDVVGVSPVGAAPTTSSFSTWHLASRGSAKKPQGNTRILKVLKFGAYYIKRDLCAMRWIWVTLVIWFLISPMHFDIFHLPGRLYLSFMPQSLFVRDPHSRGQTNQQ